MSITPRIPDDEAESTQPRFDHRPPWFRIMGYLTALLSGMVMGLSWVLLRLEMAVEGLTAADVNWLNMIGVAAIIWPLYLIRHRRNLFPANMPYGWLLLFATSAGAIFFLRNVGVGLCGATTSAIVSRVETGFVFLLSYLVLRQAVGGLGWIGTAVLLVGALHTIGIGSEGLIFPVLGVMALTVAAALVATNATIITSQFRRVPNELLILMSATVQVAIFSVVVPIFVGLDGARLVLSDPRLFGLVALTAVNIAGNLFLYYYSMKRVPMWVVRVLALVALPSAVAGDYFIIQQPLTANAVQGMALVIVGALLVIHSGRRGRTSG